MSPALVTLPEGAAKLPEMIFASEVFPTPEGPKNEWNPGAANVNDTSVKSGDFAPG